MGEDTWTKGQFFPWAELTYFPTKEVRPELLAISPGGVRQSDFEGSAIGASCSEQGHLRRALHEERAEGLQGLPTQSQRGDLVQTFELKSLST